MAGSLKQSFTYIFYKQNRMSTNVWLKKTKMSWKRQSNMSVVLLMLSGKHKTTHLHMHLLSICDYTLYVRKLSMCLCVRVYIQYMLMYCIYTHLLLSLRITCPNRSQGKASGETLVKWSNPANLISGSCNVLKCFNPSNKKILKIIKMQHNTKERKSEKVIVQTYSQMTYY